MASPSGLPTGERVTGASRGPRCSQRDISERITRSPARSPARISTASYDARPSRTGTRTAVRPSGSRRNRRSDVSLLPVAGRPIESTSGIRSISMVPSTPRSGRAPRGAHLRASRPPRPCRSGRPDPCAPPFPHQAVARVDHGLEPGGQVARLDVRHLEHGLETVGRRHPRQRLSRLHPLAGLEVELLHDPRGPGHARASRGPARSGNERSRAADPRRRHAARPGPSARRRPRRAASAPCRSAPSPRSVGHARGRAPSRRRGPRWRAARRPPPRAPPRAARCAHRPAPTPDRSARSRGWT